MFCPAFLACMWGEPRNKVIVLLCVNDLVFGLDLHIYHGTYCPPILGCDADMKIYHLAVTVAGVAAGDNNSVCLAITCQQWCGTDVELVFTSIVIVTITAGTIPTHCSVGRIGVGIDDDIKCVVPMYTDLKLRGIISV